MASNLALSLLSLIVILCNSSISSLSSSQIQKSIAFTPKLSSINSANAYISLDSQISTTNNHWQIKKQSEPQSSYDIKVSLSDVWSFKPDAISTISVTINGESLTDIGNDMTLYLVFAVSDTQYISTNVHLDKNGNKYATYPKLVHMKQPVSDWISDMHLHPKRRDRISNNDEWIDNNPEYTSRAIWPITFEFTNDIIHNKISYQLYSNTAAVSGREYIASFESNTNIDVYIMTDEPEESFFISDITVNLCYDSSLFTTIQPTNTLATNSSINTSYSTIFPSNTITSNLITAQYLPDDDSSLLDDNFLITICCSIISFSIGIVAAMLVCNIKRKQIKSKQEHKHEAIPSDADRASVSDHDIVAISFESSKTQTNSERDESVKERMQLINHNSDAHSECDSNPVALDTDHLVQSCYNTQSIAIQLEEDDDEEDDDDDEDEDEYEDMYTNETNTVITAHCNDCITPRTMDLDINSFQMNRALQSSSFNNAIAVQKEDETMIRQWLENEVELPQYLENFQRFGYQSLKFIREISNKSELSDIGIVIKGHQTKIMAEIHKLSYSNSQIEGSNNNSRV